MSVIDILEAINRENNNNNGCKRETVHRFKGVLNSYEEEFYDDLYNFSIGNKPIYSGIM